MGRMYILYHSALKLAESSSSPKAGSQERRQLSSRPTKKEIKYIAFYLRNIDSHTCLLQASPATFPKWRGQTAKRNSLKRPVLSLSWNTSTKITFYQQDSKSMTSTSRILKMITSRLKNQDLLSARLLEKPSAKLSENSPTPKKTTRPDTPNSSSADSDFDRSYLNPIITHYHQLHTNNQIIIIHDEPQTKDHQPRNWVQWQNHIHFVGDRRTQWSFQNNQTKV